MSQTSTGAKKAAITNKTRHGSDFYQRIGSRGGKNGTGHQFGHGMVSPSEAGRIGGARSKRKKREEA